MFGPKIVRPNLVQPTELPAPAISGPKISRPDLTPPRPPRPPPVRPPPVKILRDVHPPTGQTPLEHVLSLCNDPPRNSVGRVDPSFVFKAATSYVARGLLTPSIEVYEQLLALTAAASSNRYQNEAFAMVDEMRQHGIIPTGRVYRSLLKLLSKSPDYIRRAQVLAEMRVRWVVVDDEAWAHVVIGALKDCQVEIAMEMIEERERIGGVVAGIVWKELVGVLTGMGDVSEALAVLQKVEGVLGEAGWQPGTLSGQQWKRLWYDLLVAAAKNMNVSSPIPTYKPS